MFYSIFNPNYFCMGRFTSIYFQQDTSYLLAVSVFVHWCVFLHGFEVEFSKLEKSSWIQVLYKYCRLSNVVLWPTVYIYFYQRLFWLKTAQVFGTDLHANVTCETNSFLMFYFLQLYVNMFNLYFYEYFPCLLILAYHNSIMGLFKE